MDKFIVDLDHLLDNLEAQETEQSSSQTNVLSHNSCNNELKYFDRDFDQHGYRADDGPSSIMFPGSQDVLSSNVTSSDSAMNDVSEILTTSSLISNDEIVSTTESHNLDDSVVQNKEDCDKSLEEIFTNELNSEDVDRDINDAAAKGIRRGSSQRDDVEAIMKLFDQKSVIDSSHYPVVANPATAKSSDPDSTSQDHTNGYSNAFNNPTEDPILSSVDDHKPGISSYHAVNDEVDTSTNPSSLLSDRPVIQDHLLNEQVNEQDSNLITGEVERPVRPASLSLPTVDSSIASTLDQSPLEVGDMLNGSPTSEPPRTMSDIRVGTYKPFWIPDNEALSCMLCAIKFTILKRKHHCRGCGKVLCGTCTNYKAKLEYLDNREERVCAICFRILSSDIHGEVNGDHENDVTLDPSNPSEYSSTVPPTNQAQASSSDPPATVFVPVGVLKKSDQRRGEPKQVVFSDGIRPGCDLTEDATASESTSSFSSQRSKCSRSLKSPPVEYPTRSDRHSRHHHHHRSNRVVITDSNGPLHPIINNKSLAADPSLENLFRQLRSDNPVTFFMTKNLHVELKLVVLECCVKCPVWCFASKGLASVGQDEICVILERTEEEDKTVPRDIFRLFNTVYDSASKGLVYSEMSHILFPEGLFDCKDFSGFLFIRPTLQCMSNIVIPTAPYLIALLVQRYEVPWVKVFPLRLLLRLGYELSCYPCPVVSYRQRKSAFCEIGHTIVNVLADFRNYQYTLHTVSGLAISRNGNKTTISLPKNRYDSVIKVLNQNNEHVLAFAGNFDVSTDSHYACIQNEEGQHLSQIVSKSGVSSPKVTGASFIVFSGALKSTSGLTAKTSVVEDGILVQINPHSMTLLKTSLREMKDFSIECGKNSQPVEEMVCLQWDKIDTNFNIGVFSQIDCKSLEGVPSVRIHNGTDYAGHRYLIRWTEVFFIENTDSGKRDDMLDPTKISSVISQSLCLALCPHLDYLVEKDMPLIGLRVTLGPDQVGYDAGSGGSPLPSEFSCDLDAALVPVIMGNFVSSLEGRLVLELLFHIIFK